MQREDFVEKWKCNFKNFIFFFDSMIQMNVHINFNGNAFEALSFYKRVFGGEFTNITRFKDIASEEFPVPESEAEKIMNIALPVGQTRLIANDVPAFMGQVSENENRSKISLTLENREEALRIFQGLSQGGSIEVLDEETFFAMFRDKYGIEWIVESK